MVRSRLTRRASLRDVSASTGAVMTKRTLPRSCRACHSPKAASQVSTSKPMAKAPSRDGVPTVTLTSAGVAASYKATRGGSNTTSSPNPTPAPGT